MQVRSFGHSRGIPDLAARPGPQPEPPNPLLPLRLAARDQALGRSRSRGSLGRGGGGLGRSGGGLGRGRHRPLSLSGPSLAGGALRSLARPLRGPLPALPALPPAPRQSLCLRCCCPGSCVRTW